MPRAEPMPLPARLAAIAVFLIAGLSLRAQFDVAHALPGAGTVGAVLWGLAGYFTILTNLAVAGHMAAVALRWRIGASRAAGLLLSIMMVGIVYHLLLARLWSPQGMAWWADQGLHTGTPVAMLLWWVAFAPKVVGWRDLPGWLIWPAGYAAYALLRGSVTGFWPYPFLNADVLGWGIVAVNLAGMLGAFAVLGAGILGLARRLGGGGA